MTLQELLGLLRESILNDRTDRESGSSDYLWTDQTLVTFINEAQRRFAVRSLILRDGSTDEATLVTLEAGKTIYSLHESVIAVLSAQRVDHNAQLLRVGHSIFDAYRSVNDRVVDPDTYTRHQPGVTLAFSTDEALNDLDSGSLSQISLRVFPAPSEAEDGKQVRLRVVRKPIERLRVNAPNATPEIPEDHHIEMLYWAAYLALRIVDDDAGSPRRAQEFAASFEAHVTEAKKLAMRKLFTPTSWGFGRGGFSWDR